MPRFPAYCLCVVGLLTAAACSMAADPVLPSRKPTPVPAQDKPAAVVAPAAAAGEVPGAILDKIRADLAGKQGLAASAVKVVRSEAVNWPNGGLGCARPGEMTTQAIVPGYRVLLEAGGKQYAYHAAERGYFRLCENESSSGLDRSSIK